MARQFNLTPERRKKLVEAGRKGGMQEKHYTPSTLELKLKGNSLGGKHRWQGRQKEIVTKQSAA